MSNYLNCIANCNINTTQLLTINTFNMNVSTLICSIVHNNLFVNKKLISK